MDSRKGLRDRNRKSEEEVEQRLKDRVAKERQGQRQYKETWTETGTEGRGQKGQSDRPRNRDRGTRSGDQRQKDRGIEGQGIGDRKTEGQG